MKKTQINTVGIRHGFTPFIIHISVSSLSGVALTKTDVFSVAKNEIHLLCRQATACLPSQGG
jgi:hypothetical protein